MKKPYHIVGRDEESAAKSIEEFTKANGQILLPLVELITQARVAVDEVIHTIGRQTIETILTLSAQEIAGIRAPGKRGGDVRWHGSQGGRVSLADRQIQVKRPRLRHKQKGEVAVPAYESLQENGAVAERTMGALLRGVSTRQYEEVLPEMAGTVGVSRSLSTGTRPSFSIGAVCLARHRAQGEAAVRRILGVLCDEPERLRRRPCGIVLCVPAVRESEIHRLQSCSQNIGKMIRLATCEHGTVSEQ